MVGAVRTHDNFLHNNAYEDQLKSLSMAYKLALFAEASIKAATQLLLRMP